jgi:hypothetical protein
MFIAFIYLWNIGKFCIMKRNKNVEYKNSRCVQVSVAWPTCRATKQANLELKTCPKQLYISLLVAFMFKGLVSGSRQQCQSSLSYSMHSLIHSENTNWRGKLSTVDLLNRVARFVKHKNNIFNLNSLVQGGQLCWAFTLSNGRGQNCCLTPNFQH